MSLAIGRISVNPPRVASQHEPLLHRPELTVHIFVEHKQLSQNQYSNVSINLLMLHAWVAINALTTKSGQRKRQQPMQSFRENKSVNVCQLGGSW